MIGLPIKLSADKENPTPIIVSKPKESRDFEGKGYVLEEAIKGQSFNFPCLFFQYLQEILH
jgi:hypothetical protein